jgi:hypothetical protein
MTDIDTSDEAVERTAKALSERRGGPLNSPFDPLSIEAAALLRQLSRERDDALAKVSNARLVITAQRQRIKELEEKVGP